MSFATRLTCAPPVAAAARGLFLAVLALVLLAGGPADASSYVMMTDGDLVDRSDLIARVVVLSAETGRGGYTDFMVRVSDPIKGLAAGETIRVRQLGGTDPSGMSLRIFGQTPLRPGTEAVVFLHDRGSHARPSDPLLGVFRVERVAGATFAYRALEAAEEVTVGPGGESRRRDLQRAHLPREMQAFSVWLRDRSRGVERDADYFVEDRAAGLRLLYDAFTLLNAPDTPIRFEEFDRGDAVEWILHRGGRQGGIPGRGRAQLRAATRAWSAIGAIDLTFGGLGRATGGFAEFDGANAVAFNDPNDDIPGSFDCRTGGTLAFGGPWFGSRQHDVRGKTFFTAGGADVVFQDGLDCYVNSFGSRASAGLTVEEIMAHELGHTLGLGHACGDEGSPSCSGAARLDDALMRAFVHGDDRGARITRDDRRAALSNRGMRYPRR